MAEKCKFEEYHLNSRLRDRILTLIPKKSVLCRSVKYFLRYSDSKSRNSTKWPLSSQDICPTEEASGAKIGHNAQNKHLIHPTHSNPMLSFLLSIIIRMRIYSFLVCKFGILFNNLYNYFAKFYFPRRV